MQLDDVPDLERELFDLGKETSDRKFRGRKTSVYRHFCQRGFRQPPARRIR